MKWSIVWEWFWRLIKLLAAVSFIICVWDLSYCLIVHSQLEKVATLSPDQLSALLFDAASLSLFAISIVIALVAVIGFPYIISEVRKAAEDAVKASVQPLKDEMQGRIFSALGYLKGELSIDHDRFEIIDKEGLAEAIRVCEQGHDLLKKIKGPAEFGVLNNLIYYCCIYNHRAKSEFILRGARRLLEAASENKAINPQLTACRAILQFGRDDKERAEARSLLLDIKLSTEISERERKEARQHLNAFRPPM